MQTYITMHSTICYTTTHDKDTGNKVVTGSVVNSELWTSPAPVIIYLTPLPVATENRLAGGPAYHHFTIVQAGAPIFDAISSLHLNTIPFLSRQSMQAELATKTAPVNPAYDQLLAENPALHAQAIAVWRDYRNFLSQQYRTNFSERVRCYPAAIANSLEQILDTFVRPTNFDTGVRCKSKIRLLAMRRGGPALANFMSVGMQSQDYLSYLAHCSATIELTARDVEA